MMGTPAVLMLILFGCFQTMSGKPTIEKELIEELEREIELNKKHHRHSSSSSSEEEEEDVEQLPMSPSGFRYIRGPTSLYDKIAIVGAGPSGIHMALKLKEAGFKNVTVFEKEEEVGGKSKTLTYRDTPHEMGTCYTQADYTELYRLLRKYNAGELLPLPSPTIWTGQNIDTLPSFLFTVTPAALSLPPGATQEEIVKEFLNAVQKYISVHTELFGEYEGELMPRPSDKILQDQLNMTFLDFLKKHGVEILQNFFLQTQTTQGYGHLDEIPALYGLTWMTPNFVYQTLNPPADEISTNKLLSKGYQTLWEAIVEQEILNVRLSSPVRRIKRRKMEDRGKGQKGRPVFELEYIDGTTETKEEESFDFVILTPEMKLLSQLDIIEFNDEENDLFQKMNHYYYTTSLVDTKVVTGTVRGLTPQSYFADNILSKADGSIWVKRDSYNSLQYNVGENYTDNLYGGAPDGRFDQTSVYYQFSKQKPNKDDLEQKLREHIEQRERAEVLNLIRVFVWDYFPQFSVADTASGITWDIFEMQGKYGIWYAGSSVYFESAKSVLEYNNLIFRQYELPQL